MTRRRLQWAWVMILAVVPAGVASAAPYTGPYTGMVVFGDSVSDVGNDGIVSTTFPGNLVLTPTPGPYYDMPDGGNKRFTNGTNYVDGLAAKLGLAAPVPSLSLAANAAPGGTGRTYDFAFGGAQTAGSSAAQRTIIADVDQQVGSYESANTPAAGDLFVLFAGNNDVLAAATSANPAAAVATAADNEAGDVASLYGHGARSFLVPNLPLLGEVPRVRAQGAAAMAAADALTAAFNARLAADLAGLQSTDAGLAVHLLDTAALFTALQTTPGTYGLTDVVDSAAPGLSPGATTYNTAAEAATPNTYLFWDDLHPTTAGHALLASAAYAAAVPEPTSLGLVFGVGAAMVSWRPRRVLR